MQIAMVGTGSAFAKEFYNNSALVMTETYTLLIDCGATTPLSLHTFDKDAMGRIDGVIISHIHGDHVNGLEELAQQMRYKFKKKIDLIIPPNLYGPIWETLKGGLEIADGKLTIHDYFNVRMITKEGLNVAEGLNIKYFRTKHIPFKDSFGFVINDKLFYSADTVFDRELLEYANKCDIIFHDCQLFTYEGQVHASLDELLTLPEEIRAKMVLMHYGDDMKDHQKRANEGRMTFAKQGHVYTFDL